MAITKETNFGDKNPLFLKFVNKTITDRELIQIFVASEDSVTSAAAKKAIENPPNLESFRKELEEAVRDLVKVGLGEEFKSFVNHYMENSLTQTSNREKTPFGENQTHKAYIKDENEPWIQGLICYNLCLYVKAFGLDCLKSCKTCGKLFANKGKWAVYCTDVCKSRKK